MGGAPRVSNTESPAALTRVWTTLPMFEVPCLMGGAGVPGGLMFRGLAIITRPPPDSIPDTIEPCVATLLWFGDGL